MFCVINCFLRQNSNSLSKMLCFKALSGPVITGVTEVKGGDALNLTCNVESFRPSVITWIKCGSNKNLQNETTIHLQNETGTAILVILNVTAEHSGGYICTAKHQNATLTKHAEVTVKCK